MYITHRKSFFRHLHETNHFYSFTTILLFVDGTYLQRAKVLFLTNYYYDDVFFFLRALLILCIWEGYRFEWFFSFLLPHLFIIIHCVCVRKKKCTTCMAHMIIIPGRLLLLMCREKVRELVHEWVPSCLIKSRAGS